MAQRATLPLDFYFVVFVVLLVFSFLLFWVLEGLG